MAWRNPRWASLRGPDADVLRAVFRSLEQFLDDPSFDKGIKLGDGRGKSYDAEADKVVDPPTVRLDGGNSGAPPTLDTTPPSQVGSLSVSAAIRSLTATWGPVADADMVNGYYDVQLDTAENFPDPRSVRTAGTVAAFGDLTPGAQYWVRVRAVDPAGNLGAWSAAAAATTTRITDVEIEPGSISGSRLAAGTITSSSLADFSVTARKFHLTEHHIY